MDDLRFLNIGFWIFAFLMVTLIFGAIIDGFYVKPVASEKANKFCMQMGFDFYESYERIGFFSTSPVAIKCKYVEQYRQLDGNLDVNIKKT